MKKLLLLAAVALAACTGEDPRYLANRIVKDKDGCAFIVVPNVGDSVFVRVMPEQSDAATCRYHQT